MSMCIWPAEKKPKKGKKLKHKGVKRVTEKGRFFLV